MILIINFIIAKFRLEIALSNKRYRIDFVKHWKTTTWCLYVYSKSGLVLCCGWILCCIFHILLLLTGLIAEMLLACSLCVKGGNMYVAENGAKWLLHLISNWYWGEHSDTKLVLCFFLCTIQTQHHIRVHTSNHLQLKHSLNTGHGSCFDCKSSSLT